MIAAGGKPVPDETLYAYTQGEYKALLDIAGKPMIQWLLDAYNQSGNVDNIVIVGLPEDVPVKSDIPLAFIADQKGLLDNVLAGVAKILELNPEAAQVVVASSDTPAVNAEIINWFINTVEETDDDLYYSVVSKDVMEARFPGSNRSYIRIKDNAYCGGDMHAIHTRMLNEEMDIYRRLVDARKNAVKQASLLGFDTLLLLLLRRVTIQEAVTRVSKRLGISGRAMISPYAEIAMDVDKPHQLEILRADLTQ
jgi:GTP:adenosylcobinamide-phosphate guanylyltransferase